MCLIAQTFRFLHIPLSTTFSPHSSRHPPPFPPPSTPPAAIPALRITGTTIWLRIIDRLNRVCIQISNGVYVCVCVCGCVFGERLKRRHNLHHGQISRLFMPSPAWWGSRTSVYYRSESAASIRTARSSPALVTSRFSPFSKANKRASCLRAPAKKLP